MRSISVPRDSRTAASTCIACLPGAYHRPEEFLEAGFDASVRRRGLPIDLLLVDVELEHLGDRRALAQLKQELVLPARQRGCESLWFAGISLGGFLALDYAASNPGDLEGVCLLAPYLGNRRLTADIARAPDSRTWVEGDLAQADDEHRVWRFLLARPERAPRLHLGFGLDDRFADAHRLMARALPQGADVVPGGHDWRTWTMLWENFLDSTFGNKL